MHVGKNQFLGENIHTLKLGSYWKRKYNVATFRLTQFITVLLLLLVSFTTVRDIHAQGALGTPQEHQPTTSVSLIYTGRSLGALGVLRDPDENGLLVEQANQTNSSLRLATYVSWRSSSVAIFAPGTDLQLEDLEFFLDNPPQTTDFVSWPARLEAQTPTRSENIK